MTITTSEQSGGVNIGGKANVFANNIIGRDNIEVTVNIVNEPSERRDEPLTWGNMQPLGVALRELTLLAEETMLLLKERGATPTDTAVLQQIAVELRSRAALRLARRWQQAEPFFWHCRWVSQREDRALSRVVPMRSRPVSLAVSAGQAAIGYADGGLRVWDTRGLTVAWERQAHEGAILAVSFHGDEILTASADRTVKRWSQDTESPLQTYTGHHDWVVGLAVLADQQKVAASASDGRLIVWEMTTGASVETWLEKRTSSIYGLTHDPATGTIFLGLGTGEIAIWRDGVRSRWEAHERSVSALLLCADGRLASGADDGSIILWDWH